MGIILTFMEKISFSGRIFDGKNVIDNGIVSIDANGIISDVSDDKKSLDSIRTISCEHATILPGLIDVHMHFFGCRKEDISEWNLIPSELASVRSVSDMHNLLLSGFTTVRDLGSKAGVFLSQAEKERDILGPEVISAGHSLAQTGGNDDLKYLPLEMSKGLSYSYYCDGPWECVSAVRKIVREGATVVKVYASGGFAAGGKPIPNLTVEELKSIVQEGHRNGLKVTAHAYGEDAIMNVIEAGVDSIEHGIGLTENLAELIRKSGIYYVPTMSVYTKSSEHMPYEGLMPLIRGKSKVNREDIINRHLTKEIEIARDCELKIAAGTDYVGAENSRHGNNSMEVKLLSKYLGADKALASATSQAAICVGEVEKGLLAPGNIADIAVFTGHPDNNIEEISPSNLKYIVHNGNAFKIQGKNLIPIR
jgi:imidazolonepropionase-like amidohydrolase